MLSVITAFPSWVIVNVSPLLHSGFELLISTAFLKIVVQFIGHCRHGKLYIHTGCLASGRLSTHHSYDIQSYEWARYADAPDKCSFQIYRVLIAISLLVSAGSLDLHRDERHDSECVFTFLLHFLFSITSRWSYDLFCFL
jgi:hypothetical protein